MNNIFEAFLFQPKKYFAKEMYTYKNMLSWFKSNGHGYLAPSLLLSDSPNRFGLLSYHDTSQQMSAIFRKLYCHLVCGE